MSGVSIVATIGPSTNSATALRSLVDAGMDVVRLNGAHSDLDWHAAAITLVREVAPDVPILLDIPGAKVRTAQLVHEPSFSIGDLIVFTTDANHNGRLKVPVTAVDPHADMTVGDIVLVDDGTLQFVVVEISGKDIVCRAEVAGTLKSGKGVNLPSVDQRTDEITDRDQQMIAFAQETGVDFVGISFVGSAAQLNAARALIGQSSPRLLAKVESQRALDHLTEIIDAADVLMIDRGDLSIETGIETLAVVQKHIIEEARNAAKPVIVATEMLHSMIERPTPTKAEVSDISNAVFDGAAALMLSGETAIGGFPTHAVAVMRRVADAVSAHVQDSLAKENRSGAANVPQGMEAAIALLCRQLPVTKIVAVTISGFAARMVASRRPRQPILAISNDPVAARSFNMLPGTEGVYIDMPFARTNVDHIPSCLKELWQRGKLVDEDLILVTSVGYPRSGNRMNLIQTHLVSDLRETLGWDR